MARPPLCLWSSPSSSSRRPQDGGGGSVQAGEGEALLGGLLPRRMGSRAAGT